MSARGMIMQERTEEVLASVMREALERLPRATWATAEQLAEASPGLERCGNGRYEVVKLGATVSAEEVQAAALSAVRLARSGRSRAEPVEASGFIAYDSALKRFSRC